VLLAGLLAATRTQWLGALGGFLVESEAPMPAEMVVVLAGDQEGHRILRGAELVLQGYAPKVLVSGPPCCYGAWESESAIDFAVRHGYPRDWFIPLPHTAKSTLAEAQVVLPELKRRGVRRFLVVTSDYHSGRAARVYSRFAPRESFRVVAAADPDYNGGAWWFTREGKKQVFVEWAKTVADWLGI
jgi:uncharacterized SAM-binding protein YcdF (DUF218 family)